MPFLLWMPIIMFCGLWDMAEENTRVIMQAGSPLE